VPTAYTCQTKWVSKGIPNFLVGTYLLKYEKNEKHTLVKNQ